MLENKIEKNGRSYLLREITERIDLHYKEDKKSLQ